MVNAYDSHALRIVNELEGRKAEIEEIITLRQYIVQLSVSNAVIKRILEVVSDTHLTYYDDVSQPQFELILRILVTGEEALRLFRQDAIDLPLKKRLFLCLYRFGSLRDNNEDHFRVLLRQSALPSYLCTNYNIDFLVIYLRDLIQGHIDDDTRDRVRQRAKNIVAFAAVMCTTILMPTGPFDTIAPPRDLAWHMGTALGRQKGLCHWHESYTGLQVKLNGIELREPEERFDHSVRLIDELFKRFILLWPTLESPPSAQELKRDRKAESQRAVKRRLRSVCRIVNDWLQLTPLGHYGSKTFGLLEICQALILQPSNFLIQKLCLCYFFAREVLIRSESSFVRFKTFEALISLKEVDGWGSVVDSDLEFYRSSLCDGHSKRKFDFLKEFVMYKCETDRGWRAPIDAPRADGKSYWPVLLETGEVIILLLAPKGDGTWELPCGHGVGAPTLKSWRSFTQQRTPFRCEECSDELTQSFANLDVLDLRETARELYDQLLSADVVSLQRPPRPVGGRRPPAIPVHPGGGPPDASPAVIRERNKALLRKGLDTRDPLRTSLRHSHATKQELDLKEQDTNQDVDHANTVFKGWVLDGVRKGLEINPEDINCLTARAVVAFAEDDFNNAEEDLNKVLKINPANALARSVRACIYNFYDELDPALEDANVALQSTPNSLLALSIRGNVYLKKAENDDGTDAEKKNKIYQAALDDFNTALQADPAINDQLQYVFDLYSRGLAYRALEMREEAIRDFLEVLDREPDHEFARTQLHKLMVHPCELQDLTLPDQCYKDCPYMLDDMDKDVKSRHDVAEEGKLTYEQLCDSAVMHFHLRQYEEALQRAIKASVLNPSGALAFCIRGTIHLRNRKYERAQMNFVRAINRDGADHTALYQRALAYYGDGKFRLALNDLHAALQISPTAAGYSCKGDCHRILGEYENAIKAFNDALDIEPHDSFALRGRGYTQFLQGYLDGALKDLDLSIASEVHPFTLALRANVYNSQNCLNKAREDAQHALDLDPGLALAMTIMANTQWKLGDDAEAITLLKKAIEYDDSDKFAQENLEILEDKMTRLELDENQAVVQPEPPKTHRVPTTAGVQRRADKARIEETETIPDADVVNEEEKKEAEERPRGRVVQPLQPRRDIITTLIEELGGLGDLQKTCQLLHTMEKAELSTLTNETMTTVFTLVLKFNFDNYEKQQINRLEMLLRVLIIVLEAMSRRNDKSSVVVIVGVLADKRLHQHLRRLQDYAKRLFDTHPNLGDATSKDGQKPVNFNVDFLLTYCNNMVHFLKAIHGTDLDSIKVTPTPTKPSRNLVSSPWIDSGLPTGAPTVFNISEAFARTRGMNVWHLEMYKLHWKFRMLKGQQERAGIHRAVGPLSSDNEDELAFMETMWLEYNMPWDTPNPPQQHQLVSAEMLTYSGQILDVLTAEDNAYTARKFGVLDLCQRLVLWSTGNEVKALTLCYYLAVESLLHSINYFLAYKSLELLLCMKDIPAFSEVVKDDLAFIKSHVSDASLFDDLLSYVQSKQQVDRQVWVRFQGAVELTTALHPVFDPSGKIHVLELSRDGNNIVLPCKHSVSRGEMRKWRYISNYETTNIMCPTCGRQPEATTDNTIDIETLFPAWADRLRDSGIVKSAPSEPPTIIKDPWGMPQWDWSTIKPISLESANAPNTLIDSFMTTNNRWTYYNQACQDSIASISNGNYENAIGKTSEVIDVYSHLFPAYVIRSHAYRLTDRLEEALTDLRMAMSLDNENVTTISELGEVHRRLGNYQTSIRCFTAVLQKQPKHAFALRTRGDCHRNLGHVEAAMADLNLSLKIEPDDAFALRKRGALHHTLGNYNSALYDLKRSLEIQPDSAFALTARANVYNSLGRYEFAVKDVNRALELEPNNDYSSAIRGIALLKMGRYDDARVDLNDAITADPTNELLLVCRGTALRELGWQITALADFKAVLSRNPEHEFALQQYHALQDEVRKDRVGRIARDSQNKS